MASRSTDRDELLFLGEVSPTGKVLGTGSFGSVIEVKYKGLLCAAKQLHQIFLEPENDGIDKLIEKYETECVLMASLRHPNITQFLGLCSVEEAQLPLLLMERLEMSVDDLLEYVPNLPLPNKISILYDTCCGLVYLHLREKPIVHRDLTARNVLLTSSLAAKISDLGNSQLIERRSSYLIASMSKCPGTMVYMPPEALNGGTKYGPSLDVFSFGHLALHILIQEFPCKLLAATYPDPQDSSRIRGRSEQERRETYLSKLNALFAQSHPVLIQMVQQCLRNMPSGRPSSVELMTTVQEMKSKVEGKHGIAALNVANILVTKEMAMKEKKIKELQISAENSTTIRQLESDMQQLQHEKSQIQSDNQGLQEENSQLESEKRQLQREKYHTQTENGQLLLEKWHLLTEKQQLQAEKQQLQEEKQQLQAEKQQLEAEKHQLQEEKQQLQAEKQQLQEEKQEIQDEKMELQSENQTLQENIHRLQEEKREVPDEYWEYYVKLEVRFERAIELLEEDEKVIKELEADRNHQLTKIHYLEGEKEMLQSDLVLLRRQLKEKNEEVSQYYQDIQKLIERIGVLELEKDKLLDGKIPFFHNSHSQLESNIVGHVSLAEKNLHLHKETKQQESKHKITKVDHHCSRSINWKSGNKSGIEGKKKKFPDLGPLGYFSESDSEGELLPSQVESFTELSIGKNSNKMKMEKDTSKSAQKCCGLFGPGDDEDVDLSFTASKCLFASMSVHSGGKLFGSDDEDEDDLFFTSTKTDKKPIHAKDRKNATQATDFGDGNRVPADTHGIIASDNEKALPESQRTMEKFEGLAEKDMGSENEKKKEQETSEETCEVKEANQIKKSERKGNKVAVSLFDSDDDDEDSLFMPLTKSVTKPVPISSVATSFPMSVSPKSDIRIQRSSKKKLL